MMRQFGLKNVNSLPDILGTNIRNACLGRFGVAFSDVEVCCHNLHSIGEEIPQCWNKIVLKFRFLYNLRSTQTSLFNPTEGTNFFSL